MAVRQTTPTVYKGIQMRSRLEADFAAWLDRTLSRICVPTYRTWAYEPECFASADGQWLPDFRLDDHVYIELKPIGLLPGGAADFEFIDGVLQRMMIVRASKPDAWLRLVFWEYGAEEAPIELFSRHQDDPWWIADQNARWLALWPGKTRFLRPVGGRHFLTIREAWPAIVGDDLFAHISPGGIQGDEFTIYADSATWATQTRIARPRLRQSLNEFFQADIVQKIKVKSLGHVDRADG
jgi:Dna[CI] antecedent, DciA